MFSGNCYVGLRLVCYSLLSLGFIDLLCLDLGSWYLNDYCLLLLFDVDSICRNACCLIVNVFCILVMRLTYY